MNDVSLFVNHDVAVVSILDLEQVADHRVGRHRLDEIFSSSLELFSRLIPVLVLEVGVQALVGLSTDLQCKMKKIVTSFDKFIFWLII